MKLAKVLFISIVVFAFLGSAFAFTVNRNSKFLFVTNGTAGFCNLLIRGITLTPNVNGGIGAYATAAAGPCPLTTIYITD